MNNKAKNPLYVVKDDGKGKVIEEARDLIDMIIKKFNLNPIIEFLNQLFVMLIQSIENYPTFMAIKEAIDNWLDQLQAMLGQGKEA